MRYDDPRLRDSLAAEYVLGTLRGPARDRFERLLLEEPLLRDDVSRWERDLNALAARLPPVQPPASVWRGIRQRIEPTPPARPAGWLWPLATAAATAAAAVLALYIAVVPPVTRTVEPELVATIGAETQGPRWSIAADLDEQTLMVRVISPAPSDPEHDHELWLLPAEGAAPISLGLLPDDGRARHRIPDEAAPAATDARGIAVSREPEGGSPTGAPTGEILFQGRFIRL